MMRGIGVEEKHLDTGGWIGSGVLAWQRPRRTGGEGHDWKTLERVVASVDIAVPNRIEHLMPFIGAKNDDLVPLGNIGEKAVGGSDHAQLRVGVCDRCEFGNAIIDRGEASVVLAERVGGNGEVNAFEFELFNGDFGQMHMRDRGRIKRTGIHRAS